MLKERDLEKGTKEGLAKIEKMNMLLTYLYAGNTIKFKGYNYRMDGCFNPFIVPVGKDGQPLSREDNNCPMFQNENFWNTFVDMVEDDSELDFEEIKLIYATIKALNKENNKKR